MLLQQDQQLQIRWLRIVLQLHQQLMLVRILMPLKYRQLQIRWLPIVLHLHQPLLLMLVSLVMPLTYQRLQNRRLPIVLQLHQRMVLMLVRLLMPPPSYQPHVRLLMPPQGLFIRRPMLLQLDQRLQIRRIPIVLQLHQRLLLMLARLIMPPPYYQPHVRLLMPPQGLLNRLPIMLQQDQQLQIRRFPIVLQLHRQLLLMLARLLMPPPYYQLHFRLLMIISMLCQLILGNRISYGNHKQFHQDEVKVAVSQISRNRKFRPY
jgi:hypothetical protein